MYPPGNPDEFALLEDNTNPDLFPRTVSLVHPLAASGLRSLGVQFDLDPNNVEAFGEELSTAVLRAMRSIPEY